MCGCINALNPYHKCSKFCSEFGIPTRNSEGVRCENKCNGKCKKAREAQPHKRDRWQAIYAPLRGLLQTTSRAELSGIIDAPKFGESPQTIVTDHMNHAKATNILDKYGFALVDMMSPMLDLWRQAHAQLKKTRRFTCL